VPVASKVLTTKRVPLTQLDPFAFGNPRKMTDGMKATLKQSLDEFGIVEPIVVRAKPGAPHRYEILNGHHRFDALTNMGEDQADVTVVDLPDDKKARALVLALNRISADWDQQQLQQYVDAMLADGMTPGWISDTVGFTAAELESLASSGTEFLDDLVTSAEADVPTAEEDSTAPVASNTENVPFSLVLTPNQKLSIELAVKRAKKLLGRGSTTAMALDTICTAYMAANQEAAE